MGHILFGLPEIAQFHLHSRVARKLVARDHRVSILAGDPVTFEFYCHQGLSGLDPRPRMVPAARREALAEFAAIDCRLAGTPEPSAGQLRRAARRLAPLLGGLSAALEADAPDLVWIYGGRDGRRRMLHFLAQGHGAKVLHHGPGLLPLTLQVDPEGIDGDASFADASARDYRRTAEDEEFLAAAMAAVLGRAYPPPLARVGVAVPPFAERLLAALETCRRGHWRRGLQGISAWKQSFQCLLPQVEQRPQLPPAPFVVVLLQDPGDARLLLDAGQATDAADLIRATHAAARAIDPVTRTVVIHPGEQPPPCAHRRSWPDEVRFLREDAGSLAVAAAMAVVTVNHPLGLAGILAGTPVLHTGRTPYGISGVSTLATLETLGQDMARALQAEENLLRQRFLTRMLREHHVWCPPTRPDNNGVTGLVRRIESLIDSPKQRTRPLHYRPGPVWPLAVSKQRKR